MNPIAENYFDQLWKGIVRLLKVAALTLMLCTTGCARFQVVELLPATGRFPEDVPIEQSEIKVDKELAGVKERPFVYLSTATNLGRGEQFNTFVRESLLRIGFPRTVTEQDMTQLVVRGGLASEVQSVRNPLALHRLSQAIGPYLVVEARVFDVGEVRFQIDAVVFDPVTAQVVFSATRQKMSWVSLDREFTLPMMNAIKDWFDRSARLPPPKAPQRPDQGT